MSERKRPFFRAQAWRRLQAAAGLCLASALVCSVSSPGSAASKKSPRARKPVAKVAVPRKPKSIEPCGPDVVVTYIIRVQSYDRSADSEGERLVKSCPAEASEALQWTSFLYAIQGDRDRARIIDRIWIKPPAKKAKPVERTIQLAKAGSPQFLKERLSVFDPAYTSEPKNRWILGRALARSGDIDGARREYFTYLAARPQDEAAETEYLYLNIWAQEGSLALSKFREAMLTHTSKDFLAAMERGVKLVYLLWPQLQPRGPVVPVATPLPTPGPSAIAATSKTANDALAVVNGTAPVSSSESAPQAYGGSLLVGYDQDQVPDLFSLTKLSFQTQNFVINPELYGLRSRFQALGDPSVDSAGFNARGEWSLDPSIQTGGHVGWFSSPSGGFLTGRLFFVANAPGDIQLGAFMSRRPLALDVPLVKQDLKIARDAMEAMIAWRQMISWRGTLEWEGKGIPHERHDGLLRWGFLGDCSKERCLDFFIPILWERFQTLSPYYYNDEDRLGYGTGVMGRTDFAGNLFVKAHGTFMSWQATPPSAATEHYSTTELAIALGWSDTGKQLSVGYDWRRTSSERTFRKYEVPTSVHVNAGFGI